MLHDHMMCRTSQKFPTLIKTFCVKYRTKFVLNRVSIDIHANKKKLLIEEERKTAAKGNIEGNDEFVKKKEQHTHNELLHFPFSS